ncbi:MAG: hypothetical protein ACJ764_13520 [Solirubrobacteraceae bacterium]
MATLALLFAVTGGALAAGHYLITSTKQISPKVLKKLKGRRGPTGRRGATGHVGPRGRLGARGPRGSTGPTGPRGAGLDGTSFSGDLTGQFPSPSISPGAVTTDKLADNAVTAAKMGLLSKTDFTPTDSMSPKSRSVSCYPNTTVIAGSASIDDGSGGDAGPVALSADGLGAFFDGWRASAYETSATNNNWRLVVTAICVSKG